jgi:hypothetical protein
MDEPMEEVPEPGPEPEHGALTLVRLLSVLFVVATIVELGLYWAQCRFANPPQPVHVGPVLVRLIPCLIGFAGLFKARAIAAWVTETLDL